MNTQRICTALAALAACAGISTAFTVVSDLSGMTATNNLNDFEAFSNGSRGSAFSVDGLLFESIGGIATVDISMWPVNGTHVEGMALFPRVDGQTRAPVFPIQITLSALANEFGFGWFDPNYAGNRVEFFGSEGELLATLEPSNGPRWGVHADYIGIRFETDVIARVLITPSEMGDVYAIDNVSWGQIGEPIPAPGALALAGVTLLGAARRRRA